MCSQEESASAPVAHSEGATPIMEAHQDEDIMRAIIHLLDVLLLLLLLLLHNLHQG